MNGMASPAAVATAWALVNFLWQGAIIGLATGGVLTLLERRKASLRYLVAVGALLVMAALPAITAVRLAQSANSRTVPLATAAPAGLTEVSAKIQAAPIIAGGAARIQSFGGSLLPWVLALWLAGVAVLSLYHLAGWRLAWRLPRNSRPAGQAAVALASHLSSRLGIRRAVALLESSAVAVPTVIGWLRPVVLVPASALTGLSPAQLEAILAHELAHVRRHDYLINLMQTAVETLLFYHPAVWWVSAQIRRERENCCDDLAVAVCGDKLSYARALVDLEGLRTSPHLALAASGGSLTERVRRLVGAPGRSSRRFWAAGLLAMALLPAGAAVQLACSRDSKGIQNATAANAASDTSTRQGRWKAEVHGDEMRLEATLRKVGWGTWTSINDYPIDDFTPLTTGSDVRFELRRDAGIFRFRGSFDGRRGRGTVTFTGSPAFAKMVGLSSTSDRLMELAMQDVSFAFSREMKELGYDGTPVVQVAAARPNRSPAAFIHGLFRRFHHRDSLADQLVELQTNHITPAYVRGMTEAGYPRLQPMQLIEFRIHGIEPGYVKDLQATGYRRLLPYQIIELHTQGITADWLRGVVKAGYADAAADEIISMHLSHQWRAPSEGPSAAAGQG